MPRYQPLLKAAAIGAVAGLIATVPMTLAMRAMFRRLPRSQQYPLPPRQIVTRLAHAARVRRQLDDDERRYAARAAHFGFGTSAGAVYGAVGRPLMPGVSGGMVFGLLVWAGSYLGWLPAAGILPPATRMPRQRNVLMIVAHLVWGASVSLLADTFAQISGRRRITNRGTKQFHSAKSVQSTR